MAIALSKEKIQAKTGLTLIYSFLTLFIVNALVLMLANSLFPAQVVLGTHAISYWWAIYHTMFELTVVAVFVMPLVSYYEWKNKVTFTSKQWMLAYFIVNFIVLYEITRFAANLGLGVTSWGVVLALAAVLDLVQGMVMMKLGKMIRL